MKRSKHEPTPQHRDRGSRKRTTTTNTGRQFSARHRTDWPRSEEQAAADAEFVAAARTDIPWLLDKLAESDRALAEANTKIAAALEVMDKSLYGDPEVPFAMRAALTTKEHN